MQKSIFLSGPTGLAVIAALMIFGPLSHIERAEAARATGSLDPIVQSGNSASKAVGWATDAGGTNRSMPILIFEGDMKTGAVIGHGNTHIVRKDVNTYLGKPSSSDAHGFSIILDHAPTNTIHAYTVDTNGTLRAIGSQPARKTEVANRNLVEVSEADWVRGDLASAKVVLVEYSDLQCPFCQRHQATMSTLKEQYGSDIAWVFRHMPLTSIHPEALPAANAAECVGEQASDAGFFAYVDALYAQQDMLSETLYRDIARNYGINMKEFDACYQAERYADKIESQSAYAVGTLGIGGTPATFVNGELVMGADSLIRFQNLIEAELIRAKAN